MKTKLSRTTFTILDFISLAGLYYGYYRFTHHSSAYQPDDPKNDAILVHIIIAICTTAVIIAIQLYRNRKQLPNIWKAPFSQHGLQRFKATMLPKPITVVSILRALACVIPVFIILFTPFRIGEQVIGGLDQAATNNSWGGPTYAGSMAAHYMDSLILAYAAALILHWLMVRRATTNKSK